MKTMSDHINTRTTTIGGTLLVLFLTLDGSDILRTAVLAGVGAGVSFIMSHVMKRVVRWWHNRKG